MRETKIKKYLKRQCLERKCFVRYLSWFGRRDAPDFLIAKKGKVYFVETKRPKDPELRLSQKIEHDKMKKHELNILTISTTEEVDAFVQRFEE